MKLAISNIAWPKEQDETMYSVLAENKFDLEFAPTRLFADPYNNIPTAERYFADIYKRFQIKPVSMQSVWYGISHKICSDKYDFLADYTKKAIDFAAALGCRNIVFGCPKNRLVESKDDLLTMERFFTAAAEYANVNNCALALEPNPVIYGTNFINTTVEAVDFVKRLNQKGLLINIDCGTVIYNNESLDAVEKNIGLISHVHISEPYLEQPEPRSVHTSLLEILSAKKYQGYVSIEMKQQESLENIKDTINYVRSLANGV